MSTVIRTRGGAGMGATAAASRADGSRGWPAAGISPAALGAGAVGSEAPGAPSRTDGGSVWFERGIPLTAFTVEPVRAVPAAVSRANGAPGWIKSASAAETAGTVVPGTTSRADASKWAGGVFAAGAPIGEAALSFSSLRWASACAACSAFSLCRRAAASRASRLSNSRRSRLDSSRALKGSTNWAKATPAPLAARMNEAAIKPATRIHGLRPQCRGSTSLGHNRSQRPRFPNLSLMVFGWEVSPAVAAPGPCRCGALTSTVADAPPEPR